MAFQHRVGWILSTLVQTGWLDSVSAEQRATLLDALRGLYKAAGVDLVWEHVAAQLGGDLFWCDVVDDGLLLWRDRSYHHADLCKLRATHDPAGLVPLPRAVLEPSHEELAALFFSRTPLAWDDWVQLWEPAAAAATAP